MSEVNPDSQACELAPWRNVLRLVLSLDGLLMALCLQNYWKNYKPCPIASSD